MEGEEGGGGGGDLEIENLICFFVLCLRHEFKRGSRFAWSNFSFRQLSMCFVLADIVIAIVYYTLHIARLYFFFTWKVHYMVKWPWSQGEGEPKELKSESNYLGLSI